MLSSRQYLDTQQTHFQHIRWIFFLHGEVRVKQDQKLYVGISTKLGYHKDTGFLPNHIETMQADMKKSEHLCIIYIICRMCTQVEI